MDKRYEIYPDADCGFKKDECKKTAKQYIDINVPIDIAPDAEIGKIDMECCGEPELICRECGKRNVCRLELVQKVCIKIPVKYSFTSCVGADTVKCDKKCDDEKPKNK